MLKDATSLASTLQATAPREAWSGATPLAPRTRLSDRTELDLEAGDKALRKRGGTVKIDLIALRAFDYATRELISVPRRRAHRSALDRAGLHGLERASRHGLELVEVLVVPARIRCAGDEPI